MADFDPRLTALAHAGTVKGQGSVASTAVYAITCALVYVGDQVWALVEQREPAKAAEPTLEPSGPGLRERLAGNVEVRDAMMLGIGASYELDSGDRVALDPGRLVLFYPKGTAPDYPGSENV